MSKLQPHCEHIKALDWASFLWPHSALQEAQEIFGGDFDFADFDADAYEQGDEEEGRREVRWWEQNEAVMRNTWAKGHLLK